MRKPRSSSKKSAKRYLFLLGCVVIVWLAAVVVIGVIGYRDARSGQRYLVAATKVTALDQANETEIDSDLGNAARSLSSAHRMFSNPLLVPLKPVPLAGHQLDAAIHLSDAGAKTAVIVRSAFDEARPLLSGGTGDRAAMLQQVAAICMKSDTQLRKVDIGSRSGTVGPVRRAHDEAVSNLNKLDEGLVRGGSAAQGLATLLDHPATYLLVAANNAEMRSGSGMFLSVGLLKSSDHALTVNDMKTVSEADPPDGSIHWPDQYEKNWGWLGHENMYQNLMLSPRYDVSAPLAIQMWEASGNPHVDGVITVDIGMLQSLLEVTGSVQAGGFSITATNVGHTLMFDQYAGLTSGTTNAQRREAISGIAPAVFGAFNSSPWKPLVVARELGRAASGRHVLIWSGDAAVEKDWVDAGVGGTLGGDDTLAGVINLGTNKLDQFLTTDAVVSIHKSKTSIDTTVDMTIKNNAAQDGPQYVLGPVQGSGLEAGEYQGLLAFSVPGDVTSADFGDAKLAVSGPDGDTVQLATRFELRRGESTTITLHYSRPPDVTGTTIEPGARFTPTTWHYGGDSWVDSKSHDIVY